MNYKHSLRRGLTKHSYRQTQHNPEIPTFSILNDGSSHAETQDLNGSNSNLYSKSVKFIQNPTRSEFSLKTNRIWIFFDKYRNRYMNIGNSDSKLTNALLPSSSKGFSN